MLVSPYSMVGASGHIRYSRFANSEYILAPMESLKPQDVVVVLKLCADTARRGPHGTGLPFSSLAVLGIDLGLSSSEVHGALRRARASGLLRHDQAHVAVPRPPESSETPPGATLRVRFRALSHERPNVTGVLEFLVHGLKYVFPAKRGEMTRGVATSYAAPPLSAYIARGTEPIPVWPFPEGTERGVSFEPLYRSVPAAAMRDPALYELLAIADALREARARERKVAEEQLRERLGRIDEG